MQITIGIDISKETVVACRLPDNQSFQVANDRVGPWSCSTAMVDFR